MGRYKENVKYIYCLILIVVSVFIIAKTEAFSKLLMLDIKNEIIPLSEEMKKGSDFILEELFPIMAMNEEEQEDYISYESQPAFVSEEESSEENDATEAVLDISSISGEEQDTEVAMTIGTPVESGIVYDMEDLCDFEYLVSNCYIVASSTSVNPEELDAENLLNMDMSVDLESEDYKVLIYHTHGSETFSDSREGVTDDTIIGVGDELARILEEDYGIKVYHDRNVYDMVDGVLDRSYAYDLSGEAVDEILAQYPSIEVIIDLHRDGVDDSVHLVTEIDGRQTAKVMFVNGVSRLNVNGEIEEMYNPNKIGNLAFSLQMHLTGKKLYGDFMRNIYVSGYCYNLDRLPRAALIEVGAQTNTVEEAKNAMIPLASVIYSVLNGE